MTDFDVIKRVSQLFGGKIWESNYPSKYKNHPNAKPSWRWAVSTQAEVKQIIEYVFTFLGERRQAKCKELLAYINRNQIAKEQK